MNTSAKDATNSSFPVSHAPQTEDDALRAAFYGLLSRALARPMDDDTLLTVRQLATHADHTELGRAIASFGALAVRTPRGKAEEEFSELFYGAGAGGELSPYGSLYLTGLVYDKPLAALRGDMAEIGIATADDNAEPEDHIASLCEMMHGILTGAYEGASGAAAAKVFFERHLAPWATNFFEDLEGAQVAVLYMPVGTIGKVFMAIEREAFEMAA